MSDIAALAQGLIDAHKAGRHDVDPAPYAKLGRDQAYEVQRAVTMGLGATPALIKVAIAPDGVGAVAPIYASGFGTSGGFQLPSANVIGLELEVGLVLGKDCVSDTDDSSLVGAIDHFFVGVEICGTRFADRDAAGYNGGLADNMSALGYVMDPTPRAARDDISDVSVDLSFAGETVFSGAPKHSFGTVLASYFAYARNQQSNLPLKAGTIITTGSLCGLVRISGTGPVVGKLGAHTVAFDIV